MNTDQTHIHMTFAQLNPVVGDIDGNAQRVLKCFHDYRDESDLIIFSELFLSGYQPEDLILHDHFVKKCMNTAKDIAFQTKDGPALILGCPWMNDEGERQNCALFIYNGTIHNIIAKQELPNYGVFDEMRVFRAGQPCDPVDYMGYKLGIGICEDFWFPHVANHLKEQGADILISLNGSPFEIEKDKIRLDIMRDRVLETGLPLLYINQVGGQDDLVYDGGSFALNKDGKLTHHMMMFYEDVETLSFPFESTIEYEAPCKNALIYNALKTGLRDYVDKNGFKGVLLGLSGGIDSALSAVIAVDALGADRVHCVMMPSPYTAQESLDDAAQLAKNLGCAYDIRDIQPVMSLYNDLIPDMSSLALENIQSRARGMMLMALSNTHGHMVLSTGNKSEMAVGYATLYGDMCGGFNALKDVYKTTVYKLSQWRNEQDFIIPTNIITRLASAELRPDQTDQDSLPDYDTLDSILVELLENKQSFESIIKGGFDPDTVHHIAHLLNRAEYKRRQSPPGVKITSCAFGRDHRMPITNKY